MQAEVHLENESGKKLKCPSATKPGKNLSARNRREKITKHKTVGRSTGVAKRYSKHETQNRGATCDNLTGTGTQKEH